MSVNKEETLRQFCDVTGADEARSRFFLDSSNWQLEVALSSFYEHGGSADEASANPTAAPAPLTLSDSDMDSPPGSPLAAQKKDKKRPTTNSRFATLGSLQQQESSSDEEEERKRKLRLRKYFCDEASCSKHRRPHKKEDKHVSVKTEVEDNVESLKREIDRLKKENSELRSEIARLKNEREPGQAFYAGGSERSGQQILGPPGKSRKDIVTEMFKSVRERGAVVFEDEPSTASRGRGAFSGVGYRLGQTADDHEPVSTAGNQQSGGVAGAAGAGGGTGGARSVRLRLYREGFTVDDGALRHYSDPDNAEFLGCIRRGEIPPELSGGGGEVRVSLEDRRHEECPRPGAKTQVFAGKGQMLGRLSQTVKVENSQTPQSSTSHGDSQVPSPVELSQIVKVENSQTPQSSTSHGDSQVPLPTEFIEIGSSSTPQSKPCGSQDKSSSPTPPTVGATAPVAAAAADRTANQRAAQEAVGVDDSKPVTTIQIRLADGSRLTGRFNHSHTVGDLQQYVARAEPTYQLLAFTLLSSFPSAELADPAVTIKDANLLNSTVLQRLK